MNLGSDKTLIFLFQIFNDLVHFGHSFNVNWISKVILLLGNESHTHLVDFILFLEGSSICCKVIFDWRVKLTPTQYLAHCWVKMSQVLFLAIKMVIVLELAMLVAQYLMLHLGLSRVRSARVRWSHILETSSCEHVLHLIGLFVSSS